MKREGMELVAFLNSLPEGKHELKDTHGVLQSVSKKGSNWYPLYKGRPYMHSAYEMMCEEWTLYN